MTQSRPRPHRADADRLDVEHYCVEVASMKQRQERRGKPVVVKGEEQEQEQSYLVLGPVLHDDRLGYVGVILIRWLRIVPK
ncbi:hypothetical protein PG996_000209 [Apiospora saccharicola]|uniref:Uncharacterized protein n=1 Tax=Apiospora saccharicola TaxID=335842 RepID=A0ABR1WDC8_9PEZI